MGLQVQSGLTETNFILDKVRGKWKINILFVLAEQGTLRFGELRNTMDITVKMLAQSLNELEDDELITRKQYNEVPPRVEYTITEQGQEIVKALAILKDVYKKHVG